MPTSQAILETANNLSLQSIDRLESNVGGLAAVACIRVITSVVGSLGLSAKTLGVKVGAVLKAVIGASIGPVPDGIRERDWSSVSLLLIKEKLGCIVTIARTSGWEGWSEDAQIRGELLALCMQECETAGEGHAEEVLLCLSHLLPVAATSSIEGRAGPQDGIMTEGEGVDLDLASTVLKAGWEVVTSIAATAKGKANSRGTGWKKVVYLIQILPFGLLR